MVPIFIGGCARSGTTLLGDLLGSSEEVLPVPEMPFKTAILTQPSELRQARRHPKFAALGIDFPEAHGAHSAADVIEQLVVRYSDSLGHNRPEFWLDHTPLNVRQGPVLFRHFPNARFLHIVRDGRAVAASVLALDWGPNSIVQAARRWAYDLKFGLALEAAEPDRVQRVRYEDLVQQPADTLRKLCDFCGIVFDPKMTAGGGFQVPAYSRDQHALVGQAPDPSRLDAWKRTLHPRQLEIFEAHAGKSLHDLDYPLTSLAPRPARAFELAWMSTCAAAKRRFRDRANHRRRLQASSSLP